MWKAKHSVTLSLIVCGILSTALLAIVFFGPKLFTLYLTAFRGWKPNTESIRYMGKVFAFCFYPCSGFAAIILGSLILLLLNIKIGRVFIGQNVALLKIISWCCFIIAAITLAGAFFYMPFGFVALAGAFVGMLLRVLKNIMQSAVELREENDLTI